MPEPCAETVAESHRRTSTEIAAAFAAAQRWEPDPLEAEPQCLALTTRLRNLSEVRQLVTQYRQTSSQTLTGRQLGQFELLELLGDGGMGQVYKARHSRLGKLQAVKLLHDHRLNDAAARARFHQEMQALGQLQHPNIVAAQHADEAEGIPYLVMDYVDGQSLAALQQKYALRDERFPVPLACELIRQAALGLQYAHTHGVVHRDVKPGNIMVDRNGVVRVLDLGLARFSREPAPLTRHEPLTVETQILGTLDFMAPEQLRDSRTVNGRCDVYALAATLYFLLSGRVCFPTARDITVMGKVVRILSDRPADIRELRDDLPEELATVIHTCLEKEPGNRSLSAGELAERLSQWATSTMISQKVSPLQHDDSSGRQSDAFATNQALTATNRRLSTQRLKTGAIGIVAAFAILAVLVLQIDTSSGQIIVEIDDGIEAEHVAITLTGNDTSHTINGIKGLSITVREGNYAVELQQHSEHLTLSDHSITVEHGQSTRLRVRLRSDAASAQPDETTRATSITLKEATDEELFRIATRKEITRLQIFEKEITVRGIASLAALPNLESLQIFTHTGVIDDRCIRIVSGLLGLKELHLQERGNISLSPSALSHFANLDQLTFLFFEHHGFSPSTLDGVAALPSLNRLDLRIPRLSDQSVFTQLSQATGPLQLILNGTPVTNRGLRSIASIPRLTELHLNSGEFTAEGLAELSTHPYLTHLLIGNGHGFSWKELPSGIAFSRVRSLSVAGETFSGCEFASVALFPELRQLSLNRMTIPDSGVQRLSRLNTLETLTLTSVVITTDSLRDLAQELPRLRELALHKHDLSEDALELLRQHMTGGTLIAD
jgi:serine/threonine protein kinase